jgi:hypothetical protein
MQVDFELILSVFFCLLNRRLERKTHASSATNLKLF